MAYKRLGDMLVDSGYITQSQLDDVLEQQRITGKKIGRVLVDDGYITESDLIGVLCRQLGLEYIDLSDVIIPVELANVIPRNIAKKHHIVPVRATPDEVYIAMDNPMDFKAQEEASAAARRRVIPVISTEVSIDRALSQLYGNEGAARAIEDMKSEISAHTTQDEDIRFAGTRLGEEDDVHSAPTIRLVNSFIERAVAEHASDIHLEPREEDMRIRMRIDGVMRNIHTVPRELQQSVISRLKIISGMNIAEHRIPQDGRANVRIGGHDIDLRLSTLPTIYGESMVIRVLDKSTELLEPEKLGIRGENLVKYEILMQSNNGVLLIAGPTGSGKTSTMYTMIRELNTEQVNLITLEDPVEYNIDGVNQVQINDKTGMTFVNGLRAILRQDPDIIAIGEIRDPETSTIAMRAAITGHKVLSTIHTYDSKTTIDRLLDTGVEPYLIASGLRGIISQRLVRKICPHCRTSYTPKPEELEALGLTPEEASHMKFFKGAGCDYCFHTGYRGRTGVFEVLIISPELRRAIANDASYTEIVSIIENSDFEPMRVDVSRLLDAGVTSVEEAIRTLNSLD